MRINLDLTNIKTKDVIIVANNRQVIALKRSIVDKFSVVAMPKIYSYKNFMQEICLELNPNSSKRIISEAELRLLLIDIIKQDNDKNEVFLADQAMKCYYLIKHYFIKKESIASDKDEAKILFIKWINKLERVKNKLQIIDSTDIFTSIEPIIKNTKQKNQYYYYGIREKTPEQEKLFALLGVTKLERITTKNKVKNYIYKNEEDEIKSIALWSKRYSEKNPQKDLAIVIPDIKERRTQICNIFDDVFQSHKSEVQFKKYNISLGISLLQYPLIRNFIDMIDLALDIQTRDIDTKKIIKVIQSPYILGAITERNNREILINSILRKSRSYFKLNQLIALMKDCPILKQMINNIANIKVLSKDTTQNWLEIFYQYSNIFSFAVEKKLSSSEYQIFEKLQKEMLILNKTIVLDNKISINKCVNILKKHLNNTIFQVKAAKVNIHILGILEAEGLNFDASWVAGLTSKVIPGYIKNYFFINNHIAKSFNLPFSSFEIISKNAKNMLNEIKNISYDNTFSYARKSNSIDQLPSAFLPFDEAIEHEFKINLQKMQKTTISDNYAPKITIKNIRQGVTTLKYQIECPFKGFAKRLNIEEIEQEHLGFNRMQQGTIVHKALEEIFNAIHNSDELHSTSKESIKKLVENSASLAINSISKMANNISEEFKKIEKERIIKLIHKYLELEKERGNFAIIATEISKQVSIKGLQFNIKLDRVDKIADDKIIIDYKTGNLVSIKDATQIQMQVYAITDDDIDGVALARVNAQECYFSGIAKNMNYLPNNQKPLKNKETNDDMSWQEAREYWQDKIYKASEDFQKGKATVSPEKKACDNCDYKLLCRIDEFSYNG